MRLKQLYSLSALLLAADSTLAQDVSTPELSVRGTDFAAAPPIRADMRDAKANPQMRYGGRKNATAPYHRSKAPRHLRHSFANPTTVEVPVAATPAAIGVADFKAGEQAYAAAVAANFHRSDEEGESSNDHGKIKRAGEAEKQKGWSEGHKKPAGFRDGFAAKNRTANGAPSRFSRFSS